MFTRRAVIASVIVLGMTTVASADDWLLRVDTSSRVCHVKPKTAAAVGKEFKGPFTSLKAACAEAKNQYDSTLSDLAKCWDFDKGTVADCKKEGTELGKR